MTGGWAFDGQPAALSGGTVTLVNGTSFCVCGHDGDINAEGPQGTFFMDTRIVSGWRLKIDDAPVEPITTVPAEPFRTTFLGRALLGRHGESSLLVERTRYIGAGMREDVVLRNYGPQDVSVTLTVHVQADFADLFEVKEDRVRADHHRHGAEAREDGLMLDRGSRGVWVSADHAEYDLDRLTFHVVVPARGEWSTRVTARPVVDGELTPALFPLDQPVEQSAPMAQARQWHEMGSVLRVFGAPTLMRTLQQSREDLGALRIFDPERPQDTVIAAGAPWFMTLFGRDSILSSLMALNDALTKAQQAQISDGGATSLTEADVSNKTQDGHYRVGPPDRPDIKFDEDFVYGSKDATAGDHVEKAKWLAKLRGAQLLGMMPDGTEMYEHYWKNTGEPKEFDYEKAYRDDSGIRQGVDSEITRAAAAAEELIRDGNTNFPMTGQASVAQPYPTTENWQKAVGGYQMWSHSNVRVEGNKVTMEITVKGEDRYNFNRGQADIATGAGDNDNGRFTEIGWAKPFDTHGTITRTVTWDLGHPPGGPTGQPGEDRDPRGASRDRGPTPDNPRERR